MCNRWCNLSELACFMQCCPDSACTDLTVFRNLHIPSLCDWNCKIAEERVLDSVLFYMCEGSGCFSSFLYHQQIATNEQSWSKGRRMPRKLNRYDKKGKRVEKEKRRKDGVNRSSEQSFEKTAHGKSGTASDFSYPNSKIQIDCFPRRNVGAHDLQQQSIIICPDKRYCGKKVCSPFMIS